MTQLPPTIPHTNTSMVKPHRGTLILVLGILGLAVCVICGVIAWVMGNADLKEMDAGRMDPSGRSLTQGGKICGMISVILACIGIVLGILWMVFAIVIVGAGVAAGASGGHP